MMIIKFTFLHLILIISSMFIKSILLFVFVASAQAAKLVQIDVNCVRQRSVDSTLKVKNEVHQSVLLVSGQKSLINCKGVKMEVGLPLKGNEDHSSLIEINSKVIQLQKNSKSEKLLEEHKILALSGEQASFIIRGHEEEDIYISLNPHYL